jgi:hypothetical protein
MLDMVGPDKHAVGLWSKPEGALQNLCKAPVMYAQHGRWLESARLLRRLIAPTVS